MAESLTLNTNIKMMILSIMIWVLAQEGRSNCMLNHFKDLARCQQTESKMRTTADMEEEDEC
jgi:hypothetical protein